MKDENIIMNVHTIKIPHALIIFGKPFTLNLELTFEQAYIGPDKDSRFKAISLVGNTEEGVPYDLMHMVDENEAPFADFIIETVHKNPDAWDKDGNWWE